MTVLHSNVLRTRSKTRQTETHMITLYTTYPAMFCWPDLYSQPRMFFIRHIWVSLTMRCGAFCHNRRVKLSVKYQILYTAFRYPVPRAEHKMRSAILRVQSLHYRILQIDPVTLDISDYPFPIELEFFCRPLLYIPLLILRYLVHLYFMNPVIIHEIADNYPVAYFKKFRFGNSDIHLSDRSIIPGYN